MWESLKDAIASAITDNANHEITGEVLREVLNGLIVPHLGASKYKGLASPETAPGTPESGVLYFANEAGIYSNFSGIELDGEWLVSIHWNGAGWDLAYLAPIGSTAPPGPGTGGDNIIRRKAVYYEGATVPTDADVAALFNSNVNITKQSTESYILIVLPSSLNFAGEAAANSPVKKYHLCNRAAGFYGLGGVPITASNLELFYFQPLSAGDFMGASTTQIFDLGDIGTTPIKDAFNAMPLTTVQSAAAGYRVVKTTVKSYFYTGPEGPRGEGAAVQATADQFGAFQNENEIPYVSIDSQGIASVTGSGVLPLLIVPNKKHLEIFGTFTEIQDMIIGGFEAFIGKTLKLTNRQATPFTLKVTAEVQLFGAVDRVVRPGETLEFRYDGIFFELSAAAATVHQIKISTTSNITTATLGPNGNSQNGRNVIIDNGSNAINLTVNGPDNFVASYMKGGTGAITFVQGAGRTLVKVDGVDKLDGVAGSTATIASVGSKDYLRISNAT